MYQRGHQTSQHPSTWYPFVFSNILLYIETNSCYIINLQFVGWAKYEHSLTGLSRNFNALDHMQCNRLICVPIIPYIIPKYGPEIFLWTIVRIILDYVCSHIFRGYNGDSHVLTTASDRHIIGYIVKYEEWFIEQ